MSTSTVLLRLEGPVQGWGGAGSRWDFRSSEMRPTKSAVIGLVANALGRTYDDPIDDLAALKFGVRADRPGHIEFDYRTAGGGTFPLDTRTVQDADANVKPRKTSPIATDNLGRSLRYGAPREPVGWTEEKRRTVLRHQTLLVDAGFLVALTGPNDVTTTVAEALAAPARMLSLGRRANPPAYELHHDLLAGDRHNSWFNETELLPTATDTSPQAWVEEFSSEALVSYEQPETGQRRGGPKRGMPVVPFHATPPIYQDHSS